MTRIGLLLLTALASAQERPADNAIFSTGVALVHVDVEVTDGTRLITGFRKDDFRILDNNAPQKILYFSQEEEPLDIILLFDVSGSMAPKLERLRDSAHAAFAELRSGDRVAVMTFAGRTQLAAPFTDDLDAAERTILNDVLNRTRGGTHILGAINAATQIFLREPRTQRRRAILIVTDNHGQPSGHRETTVRNLWEADAVLSGLQIRARGETATLNIGRVISPAAAFMNAESMTGVAEQTGGDLLKGDEPGEEFRELIRRMRLRYSLYYAMPAGKPGEQRKLKITLTDEAQKKNPQGRVRARSGYTIPKAAKAGA